MYFYLKKLKIKLIFYFHRLTLNLMGWFPCWLVTMVDVRSVIMLQWLISKLQMIGFLCHGKVPFDIDLDLFKSTLHGLICTNILHFKYFLSC